MAKEITQAKAPDPMPMTREAFAKTHGTAVYWLTGAGIFLNSRGTTIMVDPVLSLVSEDPPISEVEGAPQYTMPPIRAHDVGKLDAVLYTHADEDHMGPLTVRALAEKQVVFHGPALVRQKLMELGVDDRQIVAHPPNDRFRVGCVDVQMTPADHPWQAEFPERKLYVYRPQDCCGFKFYTPDGVVWDPGDSRLLDEHFDNADVDLLFMDFEDNSPLHHFGTEPSLRLVNHLRQADVIMFHWGTYYGPEKAWFAADPETVRHRIERPERFLEPRPGEKVPIAYRK